MTVWVVMGNDYPDAVFASEKKAGAYIAMKKQEKPIHQPAPSIYWRAYEFEVRR